jgi:hypothetical protein
MSRDAKLDLQALRAASSAARERVQQLPTWVQDAVRVVSSAASSSESRQALSAADARKARREL